MRTRGELGLSAEDLVVGTVARLAPLKGHDDLLDSMPAMMRHHPNLKLLWVGDGWWRDRLERRIRELGLSERVVIAGLVPPERIPQMLRAMDVLVHPSYREGLALTLPQALLCGVPVISYDCDGAPEMCIKGRTGKLVPTGDREALADAVGWMAQNPHRRIEMARRGRERCKHQFDAERMVDQVESLYRRLLDEDGLNT